MTVPTTLHESLSKAADWLDVGDKAMLALTEVKEAGPEVISSVSGDSVQKCLRLASQILESKYPELSKEVWDQVLAEVGEIE